MKKLFLFLFIPLALCEEVTPAKPVTVPSLTAEEKLELDHLALQATVAELVAERTYKELKNDVANLQKKYNAKLAELSRKCGIGLVPDVNGVLDCPKKK